MQTVTCSINVQTHLLLLRSLDLWGLQYICNVEALHMLTKGLMVLEHLTALGVGEVSTQMLAPLMTHLCLTSLSMEINDLRQEPVILSPLSTNLCQLDIKMDQPVCFNHQL